MNLRIGQNGAALGPKNCSEWSRSWILELVRMEQLLDLRIGKNGAVLGPKNWSEWSSS